MPLHTTADVESIPTLHSYFLDLELESTIALTAALVCRPTVTCVLSMMAIQASLAEHVCWIDWLHNSDVFIHSQRKGYHAFFLTIDTVSIVM